MISVLKADGDSGCSSASCPLGGCSELKGFTLFLQRNESPGDNYICRYCNNFCILIIDNDDNYLDCIYLQ